MLRETTAGRLHWRWWRRQRWEICWRTRRRWWRTRWLRHYSHIAVIVRARRRRWWIWLTIILILHANYRRRWGNFRGTIAIVAIRFAGVIRIGLVADVCGAGCWRWWLIYNAIMTIRATWACRWWGWRINRISAHAAAICCWTGGACDVITIIRVDAVAWI